MTEITVTRSPEGWRASLGKWRQAPAGWRYRPRSWASLTPAEVAALGVGPYPVGEWASIRFPEKKLPELACRLRAVAMIRWWPYTGPNGMLVRIPKAEGSKRTPVALDRRPMVGESYP